MTNENTLNPCVRPHCPYCGDHEQQYMDGIAMWDTDKQAWVLTGTCDTGYCGNCETESKRFKWQEVPREQ
jgi:hypothetical protein